MVTVVLLVTFGAVKLPVEEIVPAVVVHVTFVFVVFKTVARNCCVPLDGTVSVPGATAMLTGGWLRVIVNSPLPYFVPASVTYTLKVN
jgi:hypothetical protein